MTEISFPTPVITQILSSNPDREAAVVEWVGLSWHERQRSRQRVHTDRGTELCLALPRGTVLRQGDLLYQDPERQIRVQAQPEALLQIHPQGMIQLAQIAHHLGNCHRSAQLLEDGSLVVQPDPPLLAWLRDRQIPTFPCERAFDPNLSGQAHEIVL